MIQPSIPVNHCFDQVNQWLEIQFKKILFFINPFKAKKRKEHHSIRIMVFTFLESLISVKVATNPLHTIS